jgi:hypothetical protein
MTPEQMLRVVDTYREQLEDMGLKPLDPEDYAAFRDEDVFPEPGAEALQYIFGMFPELDRMLREDPEGSWEKANRWLGFIQGVLWTVGVYPISEMRDHNRGW